MSNYVDRKTFWIMWKIKEYSGLHTWRERLFNTRVGSISGFFSRFDQLMTLMAFRIPDRSFPVLFPATKNESKNDERQPKSSNPIV